MKNGIVVPFIVAVLFGAVGFYGGMRYQQSKTQSLGMRVFGNGNNGSPSSFSRNRENQPSGTMGMNRMSGFRPVAGEIISADSGSITVKLEDGSSKIILISDDTKINKAESVSKSSLIKGETVSVFGNENSDGSVSAENIQLNPQNQMLQNAK